MFFCMLKWLTKSKAFEHMAQCSSKCVAQPCPNIYNFLENDLSEKKNYVTF